MSRLTADITYKYNLSQKYTALFFTFYDNFGKCGLLVHNLFILKLINSETNYGGSKIATSPQIRCRSSFLNVKSKVNEIVYI